MIKIKKDSVVFYELNDFTFQESEMGDSNITCSAKLPIPVGGRNLLLNSRGLQFWPNNTGLGANSIHDEDGGFVRATPDLGLYTSLFHFATNFSKQLIIGSNCSSSIQVRSQKSTQFRAWVSNGNNTQAILLIDKYLVAGEWTTVEMNDYVIDSVSTNIVLFVFVCTESDSYLDYRNLKIEEGIHVTNWIPAEEDSVFSKDMYVEHKGEKFYLTTTEPQASKDISSLMYNYSLVFDSERSELKRRMVRDLAWNGVDTYISQGQVFSTDATLADFFDLIQHNLTDCFGSKWTIDINQALDQPNSVKIDVSNSYIWDLLLKTYEYYGVRWKIVSISGGMCIKVGYPADEISHIFQYGGDTGLTKITRELSGTKIVNRLRGVGGTRNLPTNYLTNRYSNFPADPNANPNVIPATLSFKNLMPKCFRDSLRAGATLIDYVQDDSLVLKNGIIEDGLAPNEEIYPSIEGVEVLGKGRIDEIVSAEIPEFDDPEYKGGVKVTGVECKASSITSSATKTSVSETEVFVLTDSCIRAKINLQFIDTYENTSFPSPNSSIEFKSKSGKTVYLLTRPTALSTSVQLYKVGVGNVGVATSMSIGDVDTTKEIVHTGLIVGDSYKFIVTTVGAGAMRYKEGDAAIATIPWTVSAKLFDISNISGIYKPTFDIWIKDVDFNLADVLADGSAKYAGTEDGKIAFKSGDLAGYEFTILKIGKTFASTPDTSKSLNSVPSAYKITLIKSDDEYKVSGTMLPSMSVHSIAGDKIAFIGIQMPQSYVENAESRLQDYMIEQLNLVKAENPTYTIELFDIFIKENPSIEALIRAGNSIRIADPRLINGNIVLQINAVTANYKDILPKYTVTVTNKVTVAGSAVQRIQSQIDALYTGQYSAAQSSALALAALDGRYIRKTVEDSAYQPVTFEKGAIVSHLETTDFRQGQFGGSGGGMFKGADGKTVLEIDNLNVRNKAIFNELVINQIKFQGGIVVYSAANMEISAVDAIGSDFRLYFDTKGNTIHNQFVYGDIIRCQRFSSTVGDSKYYSTVVVNVGVDFVDLSYIDRQVGCDFTPEIGDQIVQFGHVSDITRQSIIEMDVTNGGKQTFYQHVNSYDLTDRNFVDIGMVYKDGSWTNMIRAFGDAYFGARDESTYFKFDESENKVEIRAKVSFLTPKEHPEDPDNYDDAGIVIKNINASIVATNQALAAVSGDVDDVASALSALDEEITTTFKDGIIEAAEAKSIEKYINSLNSEKADIDSRYTTIYNDASLLGSAKTDLAAKKSNYNSAHSNLINSINTAITDGKTTLLEKADVDAKFALYSTSLSALSSSFDSASISISNERANTGIAAAQEAAALDASNKSNAAQVAAQEYALAKAALAETTAKAHADGAVDAEEQRAIADATSKAEAARVAAVDAAAIDASAKSAVARAEAIAAAEQALNSNVATINSKFTTLQSQVDGEINNWFYPYAPSFSAYPVTEWDTNAKKDAHVGDTFTNTQQFVSNDQTPDAGKSWRFVKDSGVWSWTPIADSDSVLALQRAAAAQSTADGKCTTFLTQPTSYKKGDIWILDGDWNGYKSGEMLNASTDSPSFIAGHWGKKVNYTDDAAVNNLVIGCTNLLPNSSVEVISQSEFCTYADLAPIFDKYGLVEYTISFDIKAQVAGNLNVYSQNGDGARYGFNGNVAATVAYTRKSVTITPILTNGSIVQSMLAFYGTYGTGVKPSIKNVKVEFGKKATVWTPAIADIDASIAIAKKSGDDANILLADIASDNVIDPSEKQRLKKEWDVILGEMSTIADQAISFSLDYMDWAYAKDALDEVISTNLNNLTTRWDLGVGGGASLRAKFVTYYNERTKLLNAIATAAKQAGIDAVSNMVIGGRNYLQNSSFEFNWDGKVQGCVNITVVGAAGNGGGSCAGIYRSSGLITDDGYAYVDFNVVPAGTYMFGVDIKSDTAGCHILNDIRVCIKENWSSFGNIAVADPIPTTWTRYYVEVTLPTNTGFGFIMRPNTNITTGTVFYDNFMLEKSTKKNEWKAAPEDVQQQIDDFSKDSILQPFEKQALKKEWIILQTEHIYLVSQCYNFENFTVANEFAWTAFEGSTSKYQYLSDYLTPLLADITTQSAIDGPTFREKFRQYAEVKDRIKNAIIETQRAETKEVAYDLENMVIGGENLVPNSYINSVGKAAFDFREFDVIEGKTYILSAVGNIDQAAIDEGSFGRIYLYSFQADGYNWEQVYVQLFFYNTSSETKWALFTPTKNQRLFMYSTGTNMVFGNLTMISYSCQEGTRPTNWKPATKYISDAIKADGTTVDGGLLCTNLLQLKNAAGTVVGGMSGLKDDPVGFWTGGTYQNALNDAVRAFKSVMATGALDKKDGSGHRAKGNFAWNTDGDVFFKGDIEAGGGKIGNFDIGIDGDIIGYDETEERVRLSTNPLTVLDILKSGFYVAGTEIFQGGSGGSGYVGYSYNPEWVESQLTYTSGAVTINLTKQTKIRLVRGGALSVNRQVYGSPETTTNQIFDYFKVDGTNTPTVNNYEVTLAAGTHTVQYILYASFNVPAGSYDFVQLQHATAPRIEYQNFPPSHTEIGNNGLFSYWSNAIYMYFSSTNGFVVRGATDVPAGLGGASINGSGGFVSSWGKITGTDKVVKSGSNYTITHNIGDTNYSIIMSPMSASMPYFSSKSANTIVVTCAGGFDFTLIRTI